MSIRSRALRKIKKPAPSNDATISVDALHSIVAAARPLIEDWLDIADQLAAFRETADEKNLDWSQIKNLIKAQILDERDDGDRVQKLAAKADKISEYLELLRPNSRDKKSPNGSSGERSDGSSDCMGSGLVRRGGVYLDSERAENADDRRNSDGAQADNRITCCASGGSDNATVRKKRESSHQVAMETDGCGGRDRFAENAAAFGNETKRSGFGLGIACDQNEREASWQSGLHLGAEKPTASCDEGVQDGRIPTVATGPLEANSIPDVPPIASGQASHEYRDAEATPRAPSTDVASQFIDLDSASPLDDPVARAVFGSQFTDDELNKIPEFLRRPLVSA